MSRRIKPTPISISTRTILTVLAIVGAVALFWFIRDILAIFFVALLFAALIDPFADWFEKHHIPRGLGVLVVYVVLAGVVTLGFLLIIPPLVEQLTALGAALGGSVGSVRTLVDQVVSFSAQYGLSDNVASGLAGLQETLTSSATGLVEAVSNVFHAIAGLILVLVLTFYMVVEEADAKRMFKHLAPKRYQPYLVGLAGRIQEKLGHWLRGQLLLMLAIGVLTYVALLILGVEYALALAIFAGLAELVPYLGPTIALIPAVLIGLATSPVKAIIIFVVYMAIQQFEGSVLTPKIMQKSVGLNPVFSLFALLVGFKIAGVVGALLALPVATMASVVIQDFISEYEQK